MEATQLWRAGHMAMHKPQGKGEKSPENTSDPGVFRVSSRRKVTTSRDFASHMLRMCRLQILGSDGVFATIPGRDRNWQLLGNKCRHNDPGFTAAGDSSGFCVVLTCALAAALFAGQPDVGGHVTCLTIPPVLPWNYCFQDCLSHRPQDRATGTCRPGSQSARRTAFGV